MGSGKTTVARIAAERLGRQVIDSDQVIERLTGRTVRQIFADEGEDAFRAFETAALLDALATSEPAVIAAAGGVVLREQNRTALKQANARIVWLWASPDVLVPRAMSGGPRPRCHPGTVRGAPPAAGRRSSGYLAANVRRTRGALPRGGRRRRVGRQSQ